MRAPCRPILVLLLAVVPSIALAQESPGIRPIAGSKGWFGITLMLSAPQGDFNRYVGNGFGVNFNVAPKIEPSGALLLRFDLGFLQYGNERKTVCLSTTIGCRITVDVNTSNDILVGGVGPELVLPRGTVRPYATATAGFAYFFTHSSVEGTDNITPFADTKNFDDFVFAWTGGGGLKIILRESKRPIALDLGVRYHHNGEASYLREGSIIDNPDGSITIRPIRSQTNFVSYHVGASFGF